MTARIRRVPLLLLGVALAWSALAAAQDSAHVQAPGGPPPEQLAEETTAPVVVDGVTLFRVRGVSAYPAERRAADISARITEAAADRTVSPESLVVRDTPAATLIAARGRGILGVVDADGQLEGVTRQVLAEAYRRRVAEAVESFRRDREPAVLWRNMTRAVGATLVLLVGLWLGRRLLRWIRTTLARRYRSRIRGVQFRTVEIVRAEHLWRVLLRGAGLAATVLGFVAVYAYLHYVLVLFPWTRGVGRSLFALLLQPLATLVAGAIRYIPDLVFLVILALITRYALKFVRLFFQRLADGTIMVPGYERTWAQPTDRIVRLLVVAFALVIAYPHIPGSGSEAFKGITLLLGLIFSLGSPSIIANLVAGQSLAFRRAFKVGDRVKIGDHVGDVAQVRLLTTYLRSPKNEQIVIPNSVILNREVVNYSTLAKDRGLILHSIVGIGYETPWRQVEAMLLEAAARTPGLLRQPPPFVLQKELGTFAVNYEINASCDDPRVMFRLYSALHENILDLFNEYGVQIMTPAYEGDPGRPKVVPRGQWFAAPARLAETDGDPQDAVRPTRS